MLERCEGTRDELRHHHGLRPCVERNPVQQKAERGKVRRAMLLSLHTLQNLVNECLDQVHLHFMWQTFERTRKADEFGRCPSFKDTVEFNCQEHFLPVSSKPACYAAPKDVFLHIATLAGKTKARTTQQPQLVHAKHVTAEAKARAQQKPGEREPSLLVLHGELA